MKLIVISSFIFLTAFTHFAVAQVKRTKHFSSQDGLCSRSFILDSTGYFFKEWGCEGKSRISFGRYKIDDKKNISLQFLPFDSILPINKIVEGKRLEGLDSILTIALYDRYKKPVSLNFGVRLADTSNQVHEMWTDESGQIEVNRFVFKELALVQFLAIYGEANGIVIKNNSLDIYLNLPGLFLQYPELQLDKPQKVNLRLSSQGLYNFKTMRIDYKLD